MNPENERTVLQIWSDVYNQYGGTWRHRNCYPTDRRIREMSQKRFDECLADRPIFFRELEMGFRTGILAALRADGFSRLNPREVRELLQQSGHQLLRVELRPRDGTSFDRHGVPDIEVALYCWPLEQGSRRGPFLIRQPPADNEDRSFDPSDRLSIDRPRRSRPNVPEPIRQEILEELARADALGPLSLLRVRDRFFPSDTPSGNAPIHRVVEQLQQAIASASGLPAHILEMQESMRDTSRPPPVPAVLVRCDPHPIPGMQPADVAQACVQSSHGPLDIFVCYDGCAFATHEEAREYARHLQSRPVEPRPDPIRSEVRNGRQLYTFGDGRFWDTREAALREYSVPRDARPPVTPDKRTVAKLARQLGITGSGFKGIKADRIIIDDPHVTEPVKDRVCFNCNQAYSANHNEWWLKADEEKWHIPDGMCLPCGTRAVHGIQGLRFVLRSVGNALAFAFSAAFSFQREYSIRSAHRPDQRVFNWGISCWLSCSRHGFLLATEYSRVLTDAERAQRHADGLPAANVVTSHRCKACYEHEEACKHAAENILPRLMVALAAMHWNHGVDSATQRYVLIAHEREERIEEQSRALKADLLRRLDEEHTPLDFETDVPAGATAGASLCDKPDDAVVDTAHGVQALLLELD